MKKIGITVGSILLLWLLWPASDARAQETDGWTTPPPMEHQLEKRQNCVMCHASAMIPNVPQMPENHQGRPNEVCLLCHAKDAAVQTTAPPTMGHELEEHQECLTCHAAGANEEAPDIPSDHEGRKVEFCALCHQPAVPSE